MRSNDRLPRLHTNLQRPLRVGIAAMALTGALALLSATPVLAGGRGGAGMGAAGGIGAGMGATAGMQGGMSGMQGQFGGMSSDHIGAQGATNTNGPNATDRDYGRARAQQRMSTQGLAHQKAGVHAGVTTDTDADADNTKSSSDTTSTSSTPK